MLRKSTSAFLTFILLLVGATGLSAQDVPDLREQYLTPPEEISEEVLAPRHLNVTLYNLAPGAEYFLNVQESGMTPLSKFAKPYYNLGGLQIDPRANRERDMTTEPSGELQLIGSRSGETSDIDTPEGAIVTDASWSPDGSKVAYFAHTADETHVYVAETSNGNSRQITRRPVLATMSSDLEWSGDSRYLFTVLVPEDRGMEPQRPATPANLKVRMTSNEENRLRTYQDLLEDPFEMKLLEYHTTGQLVRLDTQNRNVRNIGEPAMIQGIDPDPTGQYLMVETMEKPFSYIVPYYNFPNREEIWDLDGNTLAEIAHSSLDTSVPGEEEDEDYDRRNIQWRPDGEGLSFLQASDAGEEEEDEDQEQAEDEESDEEATDRVMLWTAPFGEDDMQIVYETENEMDGVDYSQEADILFISEESGGEEKLYAVFMDSPDQTHTIYSFDEDDFYADPGNLMNKPGEMGGSVVRMTPDGNSVYLSGTQYHEDYNENAPQPFIDRVDIRSGEKERIFMSASDVDEDPTAMLDDAGTELIVQRQSPDMHPDSWLYNTETEQMTNLTNNTDYNTAITNAQRHRFKVKRADGFEFWITVTMPADWNGEPLPGIIWHYPSEYDDQEEYDEDQRDYNKNDFPGVYNRSMEILTKRGYAVIDADWPIAAERGGPNDGFVWSIQQNSLAVIDSADARGYIDRTRMAIGGHSYGAFGTANAMINTSLFKAGIAGDGNYNRTLTPMGFQREPNDLWRGLDRYLDMSPIFRADQLDGALLMYHGEMDQNVGTWPIHSKRMFHALNGIGKTAAMYMYPHEAHGPGARETILDLWTRWVNWMDHYVKNAGEPVPEAQLGDG
ncbi:MAG: prolyl oligopeptidase family serine peptidase [Balneolaceae bacterium]|nr:prolyl oligopeptidase family serine peptidase [Balneolaceae bacterium]